MHEIAYAKDQPGPTSASAGRLYHRLETVFAFAEDGDRLGVAPAQDLTLEIIGPFAADLAGEGDNLVLRAARALRDRYGVAAGARLTLDKRLPIASGIGGGSADAAAALRLLARWWHLDVSEAELLDIAARLGADVPACLLSRTARGEGKGDDLEPLPAEDLAGTPLLLVNPGRALSTAAVFKAWDGVDRGALGDWREGRNELEVPAIGLVPEIADVMAALKGAEFARMSGSGATCFGLYATGEARDRAAADLAVEHLDWWTLASQLR
jgi:4-diphosphocytidyl-2-C-methyl-D-erythritol kinase